MASWPYRARRRGINRRLPSIITPPLAATLYVTSATQDGTAVTFTFSEAVRRPVDAAMIGPFDIEGDVGGLIGFVTDPIYPGGPVVIKGAVYEYPNPIESGTGVTWLADPRWESASGGILAAGSLIVN